jgi:hypothetical protein
LLVVNGDCSVPEGKIAYASSAGGRMKLQYASTTDPCLAFAGPVTVEIDLPAEVQIHSPVKVNGVVVPFISN